MFAILASLALGHALQQKIDLKKLEGGLLPLGWRNITRTTADYVVSLYVRNSTNVPVCKLKFSVELGFKNDPKKFKVSGEMKDFRSANNLTRNFLLPRRLIPGFNINIRVPIAFWRRDAVAKGGVSGAEEFTDFKDLHQVAQLCTFVYQKPLTEIKAAFDKDATLAKLATASGRTPLDFALMSGRVDVVKYLQSKGMDLNGVTTDNECAYHFAACDDSGKTIAYCASQHVKPTVTKKQSRSPYFWANEDGDDGAIPPLAKAKVPIEARDKDGYTPLLDVVPIGYPEMVALYIKCGANKNAFDNSGRGFWGNASEVNAGAYLDILWRYKPTLKEISPNGNTPLHWAVVGNDLNSAVWFIRHGADPRAKNKSGETPMDLVKTIGHPLDMQRMRDALESGH